MYVCVFMLTVCSCWFVQIALSHPKALSCESLVCGIAGTNLCNDEHSYILLLRLFPAAAFSCCGCCRTAAVSVESLVDATPEAVRTCMLWVNDDISARGTTDIRTPLIRALDLLVKTPPPHAGQFRLPLVFLLTDGE